MFNGKMKALTFSYDDAPFQDRRLVELFNKYGLKCTFNINSGLFGQGHRTIMPEELPSLYKGHEVAVHTVTHPHLENMTDDAEIVKEVENDRKYLSEIMGYNVVGMAYPCGGVNNDDRVADIIRKRTGVLYSRTITSTGNFDPQDNLLRFNPSIYHLEFDKLMQMGEEFLALEPTSPQIFYIWGHSYELDGKPDSWNRLEEFFKLISHRDDIFYGTNKEVLLS